jgi:hypothetical protein
VRPIRQIGEGAYSQVYEVPHLFFSINLIIYTDNKYINKYINVLIIIALH